MSRRKQPFNPRNGHTLMVCIVARISGCQGQKEMSLDDQLDHGKEVVKDEYDGPVEYCTISTKGKGEALDRPELLKIETALRSRNFDLLVIEDLGRLVRGAEATRLLGVGVDHGTHTLVANDFIDTRDDNWEQDALEACSGHVGHNAHTSRRLKKKLMNRFKKFGGSTAVPIHGYIVPDNAKTYDDWHKDPEAEHSITEGKKRLWETLNCSFVADWFNAQHVPTGPFCRSHKWDGHMVRRFYKNSLLKGQARRGDKHTVKHHETGRRVSVNNPDGAEIYSVPHLAFMEEAEFDALNALLAENNAFRTRRREKGDPLLGVPTKRTRFPGQHARCWYCGRKLYWGANGLAHNLSCCGSREWRCWNAVGINGALATEKVIAAVCQELNQLDGFNEQFRRMIESACDDVVHSSDSDWDRLKNDEQKLATQKSNLMAAIAQYGPRPSIEEQLDELEAKQRNANLLRYRMENRQKNRLVLPGSTAEVRAVCLEQFSILATHSAEMAAFLRLLVPDFFVYLVRLCDGGHLLPRAKIGLNLAGSFPDLNLIPGAANLLTRQLTIDLFVPPQRELIRTDAVGLSETGMKQRDMSSLLPSQPTQAAISKAILLQRKMESLGLATPYEVVLSPPEDYRKLARHKHQRYAFEPLQDYERPVL